MREYLKSNPDIAAEIEQKIRAAMMPPRIDPKDAEKETAAGKPVAKEA